MTNEIALSTALTPEAIQTLEQAGVIPAKTPPAQIEVFARVCADKDLSPFSKEIYLVGYGGKYSVITGIDGFRKIAERTGLLAGIDDAKFDHQSDGNFRTPADFKPGEKPKSATVTIWKNVGGVRCPFTHTAVFSEFAGSGKWQNMPFQMIAKVAESFALRKGFSSALSGIRDESEVAAISDTSIGQPGGTKKTVVGVDFIQEAGQWLERVKSRLANVEDFNSNVQYLRDETMEGINAAENVPDKKAATEMGKAKMNALTVYAASVGIIWDGQKKEFENAKPAAAAQ